MDYKNITPQSYQERVKQYDESVEGFDEGNYRQPKRTPEEVSQRTIDIEEDIARHLLKDAASTGYAIPCDYVRQVVSDLNFTGRIHENDELNAWYSQAFNGVEPEGAPEDIRERQQQTQLDLAKLILADGIVNHRLYGYSGSEHASNLGFGIGAATSLAAGIIDFHKRYIHALSI